MCEWSQCGGVWTSDLALQLHSFEFDLSELSLGLRLPQPDAHQFVLQLVQSVLLRGFLPVASSVACAAASGHMMLQESRTTALNSPALPLVKHDEGRAEKRQVCVLHLPALVELCNTVLHLPEGAQRLQLPQLHLLHLLLQRSHVVLVGQAAASLHVQVCSTNRLHEQGSLGL